MCIRVGSLGSHSPGMASERSYTDQFRVSCGGVAVRGHRSVRETPIFGAGSRTSVSLVVQRSAVEGSLPFGTNLMAEKLGSDDGRLEFREHNLCLRSCRAGWRVPWRRDRASNEPRMDQAVTEASRARRMVARGGEGRRGWATAAGGARVPLDEAVSALGINAHGPPPWRGLA